MVSSDKKYAPHGTCSISRNNGRLRIRLPKALYEGKQKHLSLEISDTPENQIKANQIVGVMNNDILLGCFDYTWEKYRIFKKSSKLVHKDSSSIQEIWDGYLAFGNKANKWKPSTLGNQMAQYTRDIKKLPFQFPEDALKIRRHLLDTKKSIDAARRILIQLNAACSWAVTEKLIRDNPFEGLSNGLKKNNRDDDSKPEPFEIEEMNRIIDKFRYEAFLSPGRSNKLLKTWFYYVQFLFFTGARPSEAIGLKWGDVDPEKLVFRRTVTDAKKLGYIESEGLKTQNSRAFPIDSKLKELLNEIKGNCYSSSDESYVFQRMDNGKIKPILQKTFGRHFRRILNQLGIRERKAYCTRHTFISHQVNTGVPLGVVAKWVGNSPDVITKYYHQVEKGIMPIRDSHTTSSN